MKIILIIAYLLLSFLLPAQATEHSFLSWLANDWHRSTLGRVIHNFVDNKVMSGFDVLIFDQNPPPPDNVKNALESIKSPVATSFLAYCKLYNKTVDKNNYFSNGIAWSYLVIRIHQAENNDNKTGAVTGWYVGASGADYQTLGAFKDVSGAFIGSWSRSKKDSPMEFDWKLVNKKGETPDAEGFEHFIGIADPDNATICGDWEGYCERLKIQDMDHQYGTMRLIAGSLYPEDYSFAMNKVTRDPTWDEEKVKQILNDYNNMAAIFGPGCFSYFLNHKEQEQIVSYYVYNAWEAYEEKLPENIRNRKVNIIDFIVDIKTRIESDAQNGEEVPLQFKKDEKDNKYHLIISPSFFLDKNLKKYDNNLNSSEINNIRIAKIGHEILGHGIIFRYYNDLQIYQINENKDISKGLSVRYRVPLEKNNDYKIINGQFDQSESFKFREGIAVCIEYEILTSIAPLMEKKKGYENITNYVNHRFRDDKNPIQPYKNGVSMIVSPQKENGFRIGESGSPIPLADKTTGRINWAEINKLLNLISKNK